MERSNQAISYFNQGYNCAQSVILSFSEEYGISIKPKDVTDCDGCKTSTGRLYSGCNNCEIRKCAQEKGCLTCAHCIEYPCEKLQKFLDIYSISKSYLEDIRKRMKGNRGQVF